MLSDRRKRIMTDELEYFRSNYVNVSIKTRLSQIPVRGMSGLFGLGNGVPCLYFGRQLVLKIVDELLDTGE